MSRAFSAPNCFLTNEPRALPWAGMNDALGVGARGTGESQAYELQILVALDFSPQQRKKGMRAGEILGSVGDSRVAAD